MEKLAFLWETWLDKAAITGILATVVGMGCMFYFHEPETKRGDFNALSVRESIAAQKVPQQRSPAIREALDRSKRLLEDKNYSQAIAETQKIIQQEPKESFAYVYLARAQLADDRLAESIRNYALAVKLNPDFVDKKSPDKIGPELKELVRSAVIETRKDKFKEQPQYGKTLKALYYLQRRLAGGCE